ncbi:MAG: endopeptidase La [Cyanophyceae cyanobacterium]
MGHTLPRFFKKRERLETGLLLPLHNVVLFPGITLPVLAGQPRSVAVAESAMLTEPKQLIVAAVRPEVARKLHDETVAVESLKDLYPVATLAVVHKLVRLPIGPIQLIVEGVERVSIAELRQTSPTYVASFQRLPALTAETVTAREIEALSQAIKSLWQEAASLHPQFPAEILEFLRHSDDPLKLAYQTATLLQPETPHLQAVLEEDDLELLLRRVLTLFQSEVEIQRLQGEILGETKKEINQQQKEFFLRQQLKTIQEELGEADPGSQELAELRSRLTETDLPAAPQKQAERELARLESVGSASAEGGVIRTYLDWLLEMPWHHLVEDNLDLDNARAVLEADHYGLKKIKDRIIEHIATFKLRFQRQTSQPSTAGSISPSYTVGTVLCFTGPPGVGKTSLGQSIARALGRPFERISLGGLHDEAELRGHRRTYIGAMPGRIVQALHRAGVKNPVLLLDELDKVGLDYRGDPAAALLEILDPQQNHSFRDLYLDLEFDLSQILFIATANNLGNVPPPLLDRLEIIELSGYSDQEKMAIAHQYLLPRQVDKAGLPPEALSLSPETLRVIVEFYTREAGVRKLEQQLGTLCRKVAVRYAQGLTEPTCLHPEQLEELLGPRQFRREERRRVIQPGVATGLAWTHQGGEILFVEAVLLPQGKDLTLTGQLGAVMQESAQIARSYIWSQATALRINAKLFRDNGLHLHVPAGAIPKDGPSAGVTMAVAIASRLMNQPVRTDTAMTGEINLSGEILPIGGVREKVLAARRAGIRRVLLPRHNETDIIDVPPDVREQMEFVFCERLEQALSCVLLNRQEVC